MDLAGRAYVTGAVVGGTDFPVTADAYQKHLQPGRNPVNAASNAFLTRVNTTGTGLDYSTYFGTEYTAAYGVALDFDGNVYMTGQTVSGGVPITGNAFDKVAASSESWITKFAFGSTPKCAPVIPGARICSRRRGATASPSVTVGATAEPGLYITAIQFYSDNIPYATVFTTGKPTSFEATRSLNVYPGLHNIAAVAYQSGDRPLITPTQKLTVP